MEEANGDDHEDGSAEHPQHWVHPDGPILTIKPKSKVKAVKLHLCLIFIEDFSLPVNEYRVEDGDCSHYDYYGDTDVKLLTSPCCYSQEDHHACVVQLEAVKHRVAY